ncbi:MAG: ankyrin repeat domain-containing protein [Candidatus Thiodiazotropha sp. (ex Lucinoma kastoroae)]|nr:ankyrin repeat domain-containing protein [Candidatus Thiodiazotropha sp. (ex Lucinoma kastoroae)]
MSMMTLFSNTNRYAWLLIISLFLHACSKQTAEEEADLAISPLLYAAETGDLPTISRLLENSTPIDVKDACFWTPLMKAALNGHTDVVTRLLQAGADVNQTDKGGYSSLMLAASNNHSEIIELLIAAGANINQVETTRGWTALIWAVKLGHTESVQHLLMHPVDQDIIDFDGKQALDWAYQNQHRAIITLLENEPLPQPTN